MVVGRRNEDSGKFQGHHAEAHKRGDGGGIGGITEAELHGMMVFVSIWRMGTLLTRTEMTVE